MIEMRRRWDRMVGETVPATLPPKQDTAIVSELAQKELEEAIRQHQHELDEVRRRLQSKQKELLETEQRSSKVLDSLNVNQRQLDALVRRREELEKDIESQERESMLLSPPTPSKAARGGPARATSPSYALGIFAAGMAIGAIAVWALLRAQ